MTRNRQQQASTLAGILERERREAEREGPPRTRSRTHGELVRDERQTVDARGDIADPWRTPTLLEKLARSGDIGPAECAAGDEFARLFRIAWLDPLRAASLDERVTGASRLPHGSEDARRRVNEVLRLLGSKENSRAASCAWYVIGCEMSLATWARNMRWMGRTMSEHAAKGVLLATLDMLAAHFEHGSKKSA
jgi:hypothetical protein